MSKAARRGRRRSRKDAPAAPVDATVGAEIVGESGGSEVREGENPAMAGMRRAGLGEAQYFLEFRGYVDRLKDVKGAERTFLDMLKEWRRVHERAAASDMERDPGDREDGPTTVELVHSVARPARETVGFGIPRQERQGRFAFHEEER